MPPASRGPLRPKASRDFGRFLSAANFELAWQRILRAREPSFKWYWRPSAAVASTIIAKMLVRLRREFRDGTFHPDHVCLFSEPKQTGLLRHKSILSVGDLIVYQAIVNVIADKAYTQLSPLYGSKVFGNQYSGPGHPFFLRDWRTSYSQFNDMNRLIHKHGSRWLAQFDFASFYDSVGHAVLSTILTEKFKVGSDLCNELCRLLEHWSSAPHQERKRLKRIYLQHGIPQGPAPSQILAEIVLHYIDSEMVLLQHVEYVRYADDIRIWGQSESAVREAAAILDRLARNLGIFPQTKKFGIEEVDDIEDILKKISFGPDQGDLDADGFRHLDDELRGELPVRVLWGLLRTFAETGDLENVTLFRFLLGSTTASSPIAERLCELMLKRPDLTETCCYYIERCARPSISLLNRLITQVGTFPGYPWVSGRLLRALWHHRDRLNHAQRRALKTTCKQLAARSGIKSDCQLQGLARLFCVHTGAVDLVGTVAWCSNTLTPWWSRVHFLQNVDSERFGEAALIGLLQSRLSDPCPEVARAAAHRLCVLGVNLPNVSLDNIGECAAIFKKHGLASKARRGSSRINYLLRELLSGLALPTKTASVDWRGLLGSEHESVRKYVVRLLAEHRASRDQFILLLDSALEVVFEAIWSARGYVNTNLQGQPLKNSNRGIRLRSQTQFSIDFPATKKFMKAVNDLRNRSEVAHRRNKFSPKRNRAVSYDDMKQAMSLLPPCLGEVAVAFPEV